MLYLMSLNSALQQLCAVHGQAVYTPRKHVEHACIADRDVLIADICRCLCPPRTLACPPTMSLPCQRHPQICPDTMASDTACGGRYASNYKTSPWAPPLGQQVLSPCIISTMLLLNSSQFIGVCSGEGMSPCLPCRPLTSGRPTTAAEGRA